MSTTFKTVADAPTSVAFGPASECVDCGASLANRTVPGTMRNEFRTISGVIHRRFDAGTKACTCPTDSMTLWLPDDDWPDSRERIRKEICEYYLTLAYDAEQSSDLILADCHRNVARIYAAASDMTLLLGYVTHLPRLAHPNP
jgi:Zn ribbon nucleic-acid-binding protein